MAIDIFEPRTMIKALQKVPPKPSFFKRFFNETVVSDTEHVDIDIYKGNTRMAAFVHPHIGSKTVARDTYKTFTYKPPMIGNDRITKAEDLMARSIGENLYNTKSPTQRAVEIALKDAVELSDMIDLRIEWMMAQALISGKILVDGEGVKETIDFGMNATHKITLSGSNTWDKETVNPFLDVKKWKTLITKDSFLSAKMCILGSKAAEAFITNKSIKDMLDKKMIDLGVIRPQELEPGLMYLGSDRLNGVDYYTYEAYYTEGSEQKPFIPEEYALLIAPELRASIMYGAIALANDTSNTIGMIAAPKIVDSWVQKKPASRIIQVQSRPLPVPHDIDAFVVAKVV